MKLPILLHYLIIAKIIFLLNFEIIQSMEINESTELDSVKIFFLENKTSSDVILQIKQNNGDVITSIPSDNYKSETVINKKENFFDLFHILRARRDGYLIFFTNQENQIFPLSIECQDGGNALEPLLKCAIDIRDDRKTIVFEEKQIHFLGNKSKICKDLVVSVKSADGTSTVRAHQKNNKFVNLIMGWHGSQYYDPDQDALIWTTKN